MDWPREYQAMQTEKAIERKENNTHWMDFNNIRNAAEKKEHAESQ